MTCAKDLILICVFDIDLWVIIWIALFLSQFRPYLFPVERDPLLGSVSLFEVFIPFKEFPYLGRTFQVIILNLSKRIEI